MTTASRLASGLINTSRQIGGALGLAILTAVANARTQHVAAAGSEAINAGCRTGLLAAAGVAVS